MDDVTFQEEPSLQISQPKPAFMTQIVLSTGIVSKEKDAQYVLLGVIVIAIAIALFLSIGLLGSHEPTAAQIKQVQSTGAPFLAP